MQSAAIRKWLLAVTLLLVTLWTIIHFYNLNAERMANSTRIIFEPQADYAYRKTNVVAAKPKSAVTNTNSLEALHQKVEAWLALEHHSAASLLAAFHVLDNTNYLKQAATNYPNDPHVDLVVLARNVFPGDRRKWLDLFKASSPSNALANYLSAQAYFQNGRSDAAVKDLVAAISKPELENYALEFQLDAKELGVFLGWSSLNSTETAAAGSGKDTARELAVLRQLSSHMMDLQKQELNVGDTDSAENLGQIGTVLGGQLNSGASGRYVANQLAGMAIEIMMIQQLDPNTDYDFLNGDTPAQRLQEVRQQQAMLNQLVKSCDAIRPELTDAEKVLFQERINIYGEIAAMQWLLQQRGSSQNGP